MTHYIGLDAHSKTCTAVVTDAKGGILKKVVFPTTEKELKSFVDSIKGPKVLAFEEMNIAHWLYLLLKDRVDEVQIAHPAHLPKQRGAKTDYIDAIRIATELRNGTITNVFHSDSPLFALRALVKSYDDVTQDIVRTKNRYKSFLRSKGQFMTSRTVYHDESIPSSFEKENDKFIAVNMFERIRSLTEVKGSYEEKLEAIANKWSKIKSLCAIPGIRYI
jgi:transposase